MKLLTIAALAAAVAGAPLLAHAQTFRLDLTRAELLSTGGDRAVELWANDVADQVCGREDIPQPLELYKIRKSCRAEMIAKAIGAGQQQAALVRQQLQYRAATPTAGNVSTQPGDTTPQP